MYPKTLYGWYNKIVRGYTYNEKTARILDSTFNPSPRLLSTMGRQQPTGRPMKNKTNKAKLSGVRSLLKQHRKAEKISQLS
jgi:hypothetical protein